jgi:hypothetical protein
LSLAPDPQTRIIRMALVKVVQLWHNALNEVTIRQADDLFACAAANGSYYDILPKGAELFQATVDVLFHDFSEGHLVKITPPHTLILQHPADAPRILPVLTRRGFIAV